MALEKTETIALLIS